MASSTCCISPDDAPLWIGDHLPGACLGRVLQLAVVGAEEEATQPLMEAIGILNLLDSPNTPRALNYRGYATASWDAPTKGLGTISSRLSSSRAQLPQVREYLGRPMYQGQLWALARVIVDREALR
jgi:hypothetical protein